MGPFNNETGKHVYSEEVMKAIWIHSSVNETLTIFPKEGMGFDPIGDEDVIENLVGWSDNALENVFKATIQVVPEAFRRFDETIGYYTV